MEYFTVPSSIPSKTTEVSWWKCSRAPPAEYFDARCGRRSGGPAPCSLSLEASRCKFKGQFGDTCGAITASTARANPHTASTFK